MMAFSGVRSSWLMLARNSDFERLAASALERASRSACAARSASSLPRFRESSAALCSFRRI